MEAEKEGNIQNVENEGGFEDTRALYTDDYDDPKTRIKKIIFFTLVGIMVGIAIVIAFSRGIVKHVSYALLGFSIICITLVQMALAWLLRVGQLDAEKEWFLYFVGVCIIIESIFTDVLLFD